MRERADDQKTDNGPLQEDQKQLPQVDRKLGTEDQSADFVKKKHLSLNNPVLFKETTAIPTCYESGYFFEETGVLLLRQLKVS